MSEIEVLYGFKGIDGYTPLKATLTELYMVYKYGNSALSILCYDVIKFIISIIWDDKESMSYFGVNHYISHDYYYGEVYTSTDITHHGTLLSDTFQVIYNKPSRSLINWYKAILPSYEAKCYCMTRFKFSLYYGYTFADEYHVYSKIKLAIGDNSLDYMIDALRLSESIYLVGILLDDFDSTSEDTISKLMKVYHAPQICSSQSVLRAIKSSHLTDITYFDIHPGFIIKFGDGD
jgi:hypothetical protein